MDAERVETGPWCCDAVPTRSRKAAFETAYQILRKCVDTIAHQRSTGSGPWQIRRQMGLRLYAGIWYSQPFLRVHTEKAAQLVRTIKRLPSKDQWGKEGLEKVSEARLSRHRPRGARAVPFTERESVEDPDHDVVRRRIARSASAISNQQWGGL